MGSQQFTFSCFIKYISWRWRDFTKTVGSLYVVRTVEGCCRFSVKRFFFFLWQSYFYYKLTATYEDSSRCGMVSIPTEVWRILVDVKCLAFFFNITSTWAQMQRMKVISKALGEDCTVCFAAMKHLVWYYCMKMHVVRKPKNKQGGVTFFLFLFYHFKLCFYAFSSFKLFYKKTLDTVAILCLLFTAGWCGAI